MGEEPAHLSGMIGNVGFDPMGLSTPQNIKWMREAELKHGRMTMLAWAGWVSVDLGIKFPGARYADREAGDFGFDPLGLLPGNEVQYKTAELTHGRAAMLAFSAVATQSALPTAFGFGKESFPYF